VIFETGEYTQYVVGRKCCSVLGEGLRSKLIVVKTDTTVAVSSNDAEFDESSLRYKRSTDCKRSYIEGPYKFSGHNDVVFAFSPFICQVRFSSGFCPHPKCDT